MTPPHLAAYHLRECCAAAATRILREREARYPALIEADKLKAADAATGLERARVIVAQWKWAMDPSGAIDPPWDAERGVYGWGAYNHELVAELAGAERRAQAIANRAPTQQAIDVADLYAALHWWQHPDPRSHTARIVLDTTVERRCAVRSMVEQGRAAA